jgi:hypothetical protein
MLVPVLHWGFMIIQNSEHGEVLYWLLQFRDNLYLGSTLVCS